MEKRESRNVAKKKEAFLLAMKKTFGNVSASCRAIGVDRSLPYKWAETDPEFKEKFLNNDEYKESLLDLVDHKLVKLANEENPTILIFLAKTIGRKRGYSERSEIDITSKDEKINTDTRNLTFEQLLLLSGRKDEIEKYIERLEAMRD